MAVLILLGGHVLIESGVSLWALIRVLLPILIIGRIAMRQLQSRTDDK